jgi:hypothetical protein
MPVIGLHSSVTARQWAPFVSAFLQGLNELGFVEGQNVATEQRWAGGQYDRLPAMATDLIQRKVGVIAALTTPAAVAAKAATATTLQNIVEFGHALPRKAPAMASRGSRSMRLRAWPHEGLDGFEL